MAGKGIIVVGGATHHDYLMGEYQNQLIAAGVPHHFEAVDPMPGGPNSMTMERKISFVRSMARKFDDYQRIVISDAFDVLFYGSLEGLIDKVPETVLISAERNCYPEPHLAIEFVSSSPWRFVNAGLMSGSPDALIEWSDSISMAAYELHLLDQMWLNRRAAESSPFVKLDEETEIFYTVSSTQEDGELRLWKDRPFNMATGYFPSFFHFSGRCSTDGFRNLLVNGTPLG